MNSLNHNSYLLNIQFKRDKVASFAKYPFNLPFIKKLSSIDFHPKVTFFVGENGSGKSTILEAIAISCGFNPEGGTKNFKFSYNDTHSELSDYIRLIKGIKNPKDGFFLRAESFYNFATNIDELDKEPYFGETPKIIDSYGGQSLHEQSHGESFFALFMNRFSGKGLYILDEPESSLSPSRQMSFISKMHELVKNDSQFIIATHSPIIMSYPDSIIYEIKDELKIVAYEEAENFQVMKDFLNNRKMMLDILINEQ